MQKIWTALVILSIVACTTKVEPQTTITTTTEAPKELSTDAEKDAIAMLESFYIKYLNQCLELPESGEDQRTALLKKYCTPELYKRIAAVQLDSDPFLNAQDCNPEWLKTFKIKKTADKDSYRMCYTDTENPEPSCVNLVVIASPEGFKISDLELRTL